MRVDLRVDPSSSPLPTTITTQEVSKAREMDALKRNLFNVRNDLENVFRTTLHDLNVAYQDQAFDDMVEEATTWVLKDNNKIKDGTSPHWKRDFVGSKRSIQ